MPTPILLSDDRAHQLRAYATANDLGITEAIGHLLKQVGAADRVPGFDLSCVPIRRDCIVYSFTMDRFGAFVRLDHLKTIADEIDHSCSTSGSGARVITITSETGSFPNGQIKINRHRRHSITITGIDLKTGEETTRNLTIDVARDLADQIRRFVARFDRVEA